MEKRRVVITGVGVVNALGIDKEQYFWGLIDGQIGVDRISSFDVSGFPSQVGGEIKDFNFKNYVPKAYRKASKLMSRDITLAVAATDGALRDAGLKTKGTSPDEEPDIDPTRSGVNIGAASICCDLVELGSAVEHGLEEGRFSFSKWGREGIESLPPLWLLKYLPNMLGCHVSIIHDLQGPSNSITCAEASGLLSIGEAFLIISRGKADLMVAGGGESRMNAMDLMRHSLLGRTSTGYNDRPQQASRPFDRDADGTVLAEGAGIVVLEELDRARRRGAQIYAEITGFGVSSNMSPDLIHPEPDAKGITIAIQKALTQAQLSPEKIQLLIPHGEAIADHDRAEAIAIGNAFAEHVRKLPVLATKSRIGNCGAGAGAIDLATAVLALKANKIPPNLNCPNPPPEYGLNLVGANGREVEIENAMSYCYTYGGQTAAMVVRKIKN